MTELELELADIDIDIAERRFIVAHTSTLLFARTAQARPKVQRRAQIPNAAESSCITAGSRGRRRQRLSPPRRGVSFLRVGIPSPRFPGRKTLRKAKVLSNGVSRAGMQGVGAGGASQGPPSKEGCLQEILTATASSRLQGPQS